RQGHALPARRQSARPLPDQARGRRAGGAARDARLRLAVDRGVPRDRRLPAIRSVSLRALDLAGRAGGRAGGRRGVLPGPARSGLPPHGRSRLADGARIRAARCAPRERAVVGTRAAAPARRRDTRPRSVDPRAAREHARSRCGAAGRGAMREPAGFLPALNAAALLRSDLPPLERDRFASALLELVEQGARVASLFGTPRAQGGVEIIALLAHDARRKLLDGSGVV